MPVELVIEKTGLGFYIPLWFFLSSNLLFTIFYKGLSLWQMGSLKKKNKEKILSPPGIWDSLCWTPWLFVFGANQRKKKALPTKDTADSAMPYRWLPHSVDVTCCSLLGRSSFASPWSRNWRSGGKRSWRGRPWWSIFAFSEDGHLSFSHHLLFSLAQSPSQCLTAYLV